ncbi:Alpha/Beta hydrolase protein [Penicillium pulvis]|uniref:Alpha/Beta hydrolase protein n=1 Tax=Penicillium pulvis TaxID=1562058 RepID=UPI0025485F79|nr:Alpha/Beta hydrolase protein [Penicillium pulvis]KAJ5805983.1 Alpha/Beta hydrolase protein [Penicillium pulvis]
MATLTHHYVTYAGDKKIHYLAAGPVDGPLIFFIHGWPATGITWKPQLNAFAAVGFRAIAPDMPGYGQSTARHVADDYCQEALVEGMMALLADTGRKAAVWVGHDWGSGVTSSVAIQNPEAVKALVSICVPYSTIELGWDAFLPLVNRETYPVDQYEFGQWDYMKHYEESFENAVEWFNSDVVGFCKAITTKPASRPERDAPVMMSTVRKNGWLNGLPKPPSVEMTGPSLLADDVYESFAKDMQKTGLWGGSAYYLHHKRNAEYNGSRERKLKQPALFIHATWDLVCDTKSSRLVEPMRESCSNLTEVTIDAAHFVQFEKPTEVNAALFRFLVQELPSEWPGALDSEYTKTKSDS